MIIFVLSNMKKKLNISHQSWAERTCSTFWNFKVKIQRQSSEDGLWKVVLKALEESPGKSQESPKLPVDMRPQYLHCPACLISSFYLKWFPRASPCSCLNYGSFKVEAMLKMFRLRQIVLALVVHRKCFMQIKPTRPNFGSYGWQNQIRIDFK